MIDIKRLVIIALGSVLLVMGLFLRLQTIRLRQAELIYQNPKKTETIKTITIQGPVRIVTRIVEKEGVKTTEISEERGPVSSASDVTRDSTPVALDSVLKDRWLRPSLGLALRDFAPSSYESYTAYAGFSLGSSLDIMYGVGYNDRVNQSLLVIRHF